MEKGKTIKVLSGSISDGILALPEVDFLKVTEELHKEDKDKKKVLMDLWRNANPTTKLPKESKADDKAVQATPEKSADSGEHSSTVAKG